MNSCLALACSAPLRIAFEGLETTRNDDLIKSRGSSLGLQLAHDFSWHVIELAREPVEQRRQRSTCSSKQG
eukprot:1157845-Pelagomonas_calceolata.AAC.2